MYVAVGVELQLPEAKGVEQVITLRVCLHSALWTERSTSLVARRRALCRASAAPASLACSPWMPTRARRRQSRHPLNQKQRWCIASRGTSTQKQVGVCRSCDIACNDAWRLHTPRASFQSEPCLHCCPSNSGPTLWCRLSPVRVSLRRARTHKHQSSLLHLLLPLPSPRLTAVHVID